MLDMKYERTPQVEVLANLVKKAGGPAKFAKTYSKDDREKAIDATFVSQIINGHRPFRDQARRNMAERAGLEPDFFDIEAQKLKRIEQPLAVYVFETDQIQEVVKLMQSMSLEYQKQALGAVKYIANEYASKRNSQQRVGQ